MNPSGDVAEEVVRMSLNGVEVAARISGAAAERLVTMIYAICKDQKRTKGKTRLANMIRSEKPLKVFAVRDDDLSQFCQAAKKYGILYCVLKDKDANDGITDIMVKAEDASKINRIFERFNLVTTDMAEIKSEIQKEERQAETAEAVPVDAPQPEEAAAAEGKNVDTFVDQLFDNAKKEDQKKENPTMGPADRSSPSEPYSDSSRTKAEGTPDEPVSVRSDLKKIQKGLRRNPKEFDNIPRMVYTPLKEEKAMADKKKGNIKKNIIKQKER